MSQTSTQMAIVQLPVLERRAHARMVWLSEKVKHYARKQAIRNRKEEHAVTKVRLRNAGQSRTRPEMSYIGEQAQCGRCLVHASRQSARWPSTLCKQRVRSLDGWRAGRRVSPDRWA